MSCSVAESRAQRIDDRVEHEVHPMRKDGNRMLDVIVRSAIFGLGTISAPVTGEGGEWRKVPAYGDHRDERVTVRIVARREAEDVSRRGTV